MCWRVEDPPTAVGLISNGQLNKSLICMCGESVFARTSCGLRPQQQRASVVSRNPAGAVRLKMAPCYRVTHRQCFPPCERTSPVATRRNERTKKCLFSSHLPRHTALEVRRKQRRPRRHSAPTSAAAITPTGGNCRVDSTVIRQKLLSVSGSKWKQAALFVVFIIILLTPEAA